MSKIEEDIPLPSVRKLAEFYASSNNVTESNTKQAEVTWFFFKISSKSHK